MRIEDITDETIQNATSAELRDLVNRAHQLMCKHETLLREFSRRGQTPKVVKSDRSAFLKIDASRHIVSGVVYEPLIPDSDGEFMTEDDVEKAAHSFMDSGHRLDVMHDSKPRQSIRLLESFVTPCEMAYGEQAIAKGTWIMTVRIDDDDLWAQVQNGSLTGFSMAGTADKVSA